VVRSNAAHARSHCEHARLNAAHDCSVAKSLGDTWHPIAHAAKSRCETRQWAALTAKAPGFTRRTAAQTARPLWRGRGSVALRHNHQMRTPSVLVTGASGEIGHGLINQLARTGRSIVTVDIAPLESALAKQVRRPIR
jgi:hypothetical protein